ncbi:MAG TPA: SGNH/GDSL hydrolase family protein [Steroidobacteraceae bacterium]|nr:SGNH/GDSL hydrolase family protein [Steroidobacteraceae bacterium]
MKSLALSSCASIMLATLGMGSAAAEEQGAALALGDSVVFGYITQAGHEYVNAANFIGSPEYVARLVHADVANAGCPGETTGSFLSRTAPDNGCRAYRGEFPLHVVYPSTQLAFAKTFLAQHPRTRLVTIGLGANDVFLLEDACAADPNPPQCVEAGLPAVLAAVASNMATILAELRATRYGDVIVIVNYYSLDYSDATGTALTALLNQAIAAPAQAFGAVVADVFSSFERVVSTPTLGGKTCNAGLLNVDPQDQALCDIHPSQSGQQLIAATVARTYWAATR